MTSLVELLDSNPNWIDVYNHRDCVAKSKVAATALLIANRLACIKPSTACKAGPAKFFPTSHKGLAALKGTDPKEKVRIENRLCYAFFNQTRNDLARAKQLPWLTVDYEVPLKQTRSDPAGKIDLVGWNNINGINQLLLIEAKRPTSSESPIKALLEIVAYTLSIQYRRDIFMTAAREALERLSKATGVIIPTDNVALRPALLFFAESETEKMFQKHKKDLSPLILRLNNELSGKGFLPLSVFIENNAYKAKFCISEKNPERHLVKDREVCFNGWTPHITTVKLDV